MVEPVTPLQSPWSLLSREATAWVQVEQVAYIQFDILAYASQLASDTIRSWSRSAFRIMGSGAPYCMRTATHLDWNAVLCEVDHTSHASGQALIAELRQENCQQGLQI